MDRDEVEPLELPPAWAAQLANPILGAISLLAFKYPQTCYS